MSRAELIRFDWAIKTILRDKANFDVLEGFLSAVLREEIKVIQILESESNQEEPSDKFNKVDLLVSDSEGRRLIIEVQNEREVDFLERLLYGASKVIIENINVGERYNQIVKVISISILYFNLGAGDDYVYYGATEFNGLHTKKPLVVRERYEPEKKVFRLKEKSIFPEYFLINVERFEDVIQSPLDEWIYMLKHSAIRDDFTAPNIDKAREKLALIKMSPQERKSYERFMLNLAHERSVIEAARDEGLDKGLIIGKIQLLQEMKGLSVKSKEELRAMEPEALVQLLQSLKDL